MGFHAKARDEKLFTEKHSWHPAGDCECTRPRPTGRLYLGIQACGKCGHLMTRHPERKN